MLTATLENFLNRGLPRSPRAQQLCAELAGRRIAVEAPAMARVLVESTGNSLRITRGSLPADAEVIGGPLSLLALSGSAAPAPLSGGDVEVRGDAELAQKFQELARLLKPDPEEELSLLIGDVAAHRIGRLTRGALDWTCSVSGSRTSRAARALPPGWASDSTMGVSSARTARNWANASDGPTTSSATAAASARIVTRPA